MTVIIRDITALMFAAMIIAASKKVIGSTCMRPTFSLVVADRIVTLIEIAA